MSLTRIHNLSISLDGFATGEPQSADAPFGHAGERLHEWMFGTRFWDAGGSAGVDDAFAERHSYGIGAEIMGANKFGGPGPDRVRPRRPHLGRPGGPRGWLRRRGGLLAQRRHPSHVHAEGRLVNADTEPQVVPGQLRLTNERSRTCSVNVARVRARRPSCISTFADGPADRAQRTVGT